MYSTVLYANMQGCVHSLMHIFSFNRSGIDILARRTRMATTGLVNTEVLKVPLGFIRVLQLVGIAMTPTLVFSLSRFSRSRPSTAGISPWTMGARNSTIQSTSTRSSELRVSKWRCASDCSFASVKIQCNSTATPVDFINASYSR